MQRAVIMVVSTTCIFFSSRRRYTRCLSDWSSDVCSSDLDIDMKTNKAFVMKPKSAEEAGTGEIARRMRDILSEIGEDPSREGLVRTPMRYEKALRFLKIGRASCREGGESEPEGGGTERLD